MKEGGIQNPSPFSEEKSEGFATVKIFGNLARSLGGSRHDLLQVRTPVKIGSLLTSISKSHGLILLRENTLVLVNGVEANALEDLETVVHEGDQVFLIPMIHGG